jgi:hypothetical protein
MLCQLLVSSSSRSGGRPIEGKGETGVLEKRGVVGGPTQTLVQVSGERVDMRAGMVGS